MCRRLGGPPRLAAGRLSTAGRKAGSNVGSAPYNPPPIGCGMLEAGPRGDCVALMRPADALAFPCGAWCGYRKHEKTGGRGWLPVFVLTLLLRADVRKCAVGGCPCFNIFKYGKAQIQSGALEYVCPEYSVLEIVADNIDGGLESIQKRWKRYEKVNRI